MSNADFQDLLIREIEKTVMRVLSDSKEHPITKMGATIGALTVVLSHSLQSSIEELPDQRKSILDQTRILFDRSMAIVEAPGETLQ